MNRKHQTSPPAGAKGHAVTPTITQQLHQNMLAASATAAALAAAATATTTPVNSSLSPCLPFSTGAPGASSFAYSPQSHYPMTTGLPNNMGFPVMYARQNSSQKAKKGAKEFFQGRSPRSGKWLAAEEAYADLLIEMFDKGMMLDCVTGSTLRAYLAQKLHCNPMRISKKFAGKGIGKKVFSCRISVRKGGPSDFEEERKTLQEKVEKARTAFYDSIHCQAVSFARYCCREKDAMQGLTDTLYLLVA
jgi:hypothetical protein